MILDQNSPKLKQTLIQDSVSSCYGKHEELSASQIRSASGSNHSSQAGKSSLGTYAKSASTRENTQIQSDARKKRYSLLRVQRDVLKRYAQKKHRMSICHHAFVPDKNPTLSNHGNGYRWHNVVKCTNANCSVCSVTYGQVKRLELEQAFANAYSQGYEIAFMTLTCQHDARHSASDNVEAMSTALRRFYSGRWWQVIKYNYGIVGSIKGSEATFNQVNGCHYHYHIALIVDPVMFDPAAWSNDSDLRHKMVQRWDKQLMKLDRYCTYEHGLDLRMGNQYVSEYITKFGTVPQESNDWGLGAEMTLSALKQAHDGNYTTQELLMLADKGDDWAARMFAEFADATKGRARLYWSEGLKELLGVNVDAVAADENCSPVVGPEFEASRTAFRVIRSVRHARGELEELARLGEYEKLARNLSKYDVLGRFKEHIGDAVPIDGWHRVCNYDLSTDKERILGRVYVLKGQIMDIQPVAVVMPSAPAGESPSMRIEPGTHKHAQLSLFLDTHNDNR